ncbi:MAG TPA: hypothetical protein PK110_06345 [Niabella sp.]|jgi:hypothetical protein|nr:2'-5' RNA ligase family protein [Chitinophagaceae bacterium]HRN47645.1 hypothetical protein [Niabella sp.]HRO84425.1 hypothetical protein [Niabella sp.]HUN01379.1 hypothetical protein [Niabella sp.]
MQSIFSNNRVPLNDYRLIIDTPPVIKKKIAALKTSFDEDYRGMVIAGGNPFIYLATFSQHESAEHLMNEAIDRIALGFMPFKLHLKNLRNLDEHEIYVALGETDIIEYLINELKTVQKVLINPRFNDIPRITIAQRLMPWQFAKSWPKFQHKHLSGTFLADKMLLLKRMEGFRSWQIIRYLAFQNLVVA